MSKRYAIRIPVHGFVEISEWERDIINHPVFQRLRRIRQLAFSEHVYPGSTHTRFEHSIGVMHVATKMFDAICDPQRPSIKLIKDFYGDSLNLKRDRQVVRLAALLHDVGHPPFSHTAEKEIMPIKHQSNGKVVRYQHEDYSAALIESLMKDVIDEHPRNTSMQISAKEVADFYLGRASDSQQALAMWRFLVNGRMDADRADYLLRDAYHCGVTYGQFDLDRIFETLGVAVDRADSESDELVPAVHRKGIHAAEQLILARFMMFTGVYFHKTRLAYDYHAAQLVVQHIKSQFSSDTIPPPTDAGAIQRYLELDDWAVLASAIDRSTTSSGDQEGRHLQAIREHKHDRWVFSTSERADDRELLAFEEIFQRVKDKGIECVHRDARNNWYSTGSPREQIRGIHERGAGQHPAAIPLDQMSSLIGELGESTQRVLLVQSDLRETASEVIEESQIQFYGGRPWTKP